MLLGIVIPAQAEISLAAKAIGERDSRWRNGVSRPLLLVIMMALAVVLIQSRAHAVGRYAATLEQAEAQIAQELEVLGAGEKVEARIQGKFADALHSSIRPIHLQIGALDYDARARTWEGELQIYEGDQLAQRLALQGRFEPLVAVPVLTQRLGRGQIIAEAHIGWDYLPEHRLRPDTVRDPRELAGFALKRSIAPQRPVAVHDIEKPVVITRGDMVQIRYVTPVMEVRTIGEALEDGAAGQPVRIRNLQSDIVVQAVATEPGLAEVRQLMQLTRK